MNTFEIPKELEEKIVNASSDEEVIRLFEEAGITVTPEQFNIGGDNADGSLDEAALDNVVGGSATYFIGYLIGRYVANRRHGGGGHRF